MDVLDTHYAVTPDGVYIAYQIMGDGPIDVVWQLDWPGNIDMAREDPLLGLWFEELASFARLILHDRRGVGLSSRNVPPPNLETRVSDLLLVLDAVGSEHPVLTGIFESGAPNALLAATGPERVQSMVWVAPQPRCAWAPDYPWGARPEDMEAELRVTTDLWGTLAFGRWYVQEQASRDNEMPDSEAALVAKTTRNACTPDVAGDLSRIWYETDVRGVLSAVNVPTLILAPPSRVDDFGRATHVASLIPGAELQETSGRVGSEEEASAIAEQLRRFVGVERVPAELDTILSTVLFTDIVDSTQKQSSLGDHGWKQLIERHHTLVREVLKRWRGVEIDTAGDGF